MGTTASSSNVPESRQEIRDFINTENSSHDVVIWSKSYCPYCSQTKNLFRRAPQFADRDVVVHELDQRSDGDLVQRELTALTGQRTVPNVFVGGRHVGGNDDTHVAHRTGQLSKLVVAAAAN
jgi:glutaredoxin 3